SWNLSFTNTSIEGDYDITIYANDTLGHTGTYKGYFDIYPTTNFSGNIPEKMAYGLRFIRPGTDISLLQLNPTTNDFEFTNVKKRTYDLKVKINASVSSNAIQTHTVRFNEFVIPGNTTNAFDSSFTNLGSTPGYAHPENTTNFSFAGISIHSSLSYSSVNITLDYSTFSDLGGINQNKLYIYKCIYDVISTCTTSDWIRQENTIQNLSERTVSIASDSTSSYIVEIYEPPKEAESPPEIHYNVGTTPSSNSPAVSSATQSYTKTETFTNNETETDTAAKEASIETTLVNQLIFRGEERTYLIILKNNIEQEIDFSIDVEGELKQFVFPEEISGIISAGATKNILMRVYVPKDSPVKTYSGNIVMYITNASNAFTVSASMVVVQQKID
ncbi:MAG: hypothetical protein KAJ24_05075, partial [Candidatus Aenigmarchaeota archaeon]|nr:hypothetical protein [Candidatus Aenigmarchaeota archaeon]